MGPPPPPPSVHTKNVEIRYHTPYIFLFFFLFFFSPNVSTASSYKCCRRSSKWSPSRPRYSSSSSSSSSIHRYQKCRDMISYIRVIYLFFFFFLSLSGLPERLH